ncbi:hypothetical protein ABPG73_022440 [Tetrahymena malaccensis]
MNIFSFLVFVLLKNTIQNQTDKERNIISVIEYTNNQQLYQFSCVDEKTFEYNLISWVNKDRNQQNITLFKSDNQIPPHYKLEIDIDFILFIQRQNFNIFINQKKYQVVFEEQSLHKSSCNIRESKNNLVYSDELALSKFIFTPFKDQQIEIIIELNDDFDIGIQNLNINILSCHPTCLECSGPEENQCTKCFKDNPIQGKCQDCDLYFQDGQCVSNCEESKFLFPYDSKQKICVYSHNCKKFDNRQCIKCKDESKYIYNGKCVVTCPVGYINSSDSNNCEIDKSNVQNKESKIIEIFNAFHNNFFTDLEVNALNIKTSQFLNQNELKRVTTKCGNKKVLGGFLANKLNSIVEFEVNSDNCKEVIFYFNFIVIDMKQKIDQNIFTLQLNDISENIQLSFLKKIENINMCGDKTKEEYTYQYSKIYDIDKTKGESKSIVVKLINNNKDMENIPNQIQDKMNKYPYFGISGLTVFCTQDILCEKNCLDCDQKDQNVCLQCKQGFKLNQNQKCIEEQGCDSESYLDDSNKCKKCSNQLQNCLECESNKICKKCSNSFVLQNGKCICDQNNYLKGQKECEKCQDSFPNCFQCDQNLGCIKCSANYQLHNNQCFPCKKGEQDFQNSNCQKCLVLNCKICFEYSNKCWECEKGYQLKQEKCEKIQCEQSEFFNQDSNICEQCSLKFKNCIQCNQNQCYSCTENFYLDRNTKKCVNPCPKGTFVDNNQCEKCNQTNCQECSSSESCITCDNNYYLIPNCKFCSESTDKCHECESGYQLDQQKCEKIKCEQNQFYNQLTNICELCDKKFENCNQCSYEKCQSCNESLYLDKFYNKCVNSCPEGSFLQEKQCEFCKEQNCLVCNKDQCLQCKDNYQLHNKKCFLCNQNQIFNKAQTECQKCVVPNCKICFLSTDICNECENNYTLNQLKNQNMECVKTCPKGKFEINKKCELCKFKNCKECDKNSCISCKNGLIKQENECVLKCKDGFYLDEKLRECQKCNGGCSLCEDKQICLSCEEGYEHNKILNKCEKKQKPSQDEQNAQALCVYKDQQENLCFNLYIELQGGICYQCDFSCHTCNGKTNKDCLSCKSGLYFLPDGSCGYCPENGFYIDGTYCKKCDSSCLTCSGPSQSECITCLYPYSYFDQSYYCQKCHTDCQKCFGSQQNECLKCLNTNLFITSQNRTCGLCLSAEFNDGTKCIKCQNNCLSCTSLNDCTKCENGYYYKNQICNKCDDNCLSCTDKYQCNSCASNYTLYDGLCFNCEEGNYLDKAKKSCQNCHSKCKSCYGQAETECIKCANPNQFFDQNNYCVDKCQDGYIKNPTTNKCQKCFYLQQNSVASVCMLQCPDSFYSDSNNVCQKCGTNCKHCENSQICNICLPKFSFQSDTQRVCTTCQSYEYVDSKNTCQKCMITNCLTCESKDVCTTCMKEYNNKISYCEYDTRYENYSCLYNTQKECEQELNIITKADTTMQSVQVTSITFQVTATFILSSSGTLFSYSLQVQQLIGNMKFSGSLKTLSLGSTFLDQGYQMNILSLIPSPIFQGSQSNNNNSNKYTDKRILDQNNASSSDFRRLNSIQLSKLFLSDFIKFLAIVASLIIFLGITKSLRNKFEFCSEVNEKNISYLIKLQLLFSNYILISILNSLKYIQFQNVVEIISFALQIIYLISYASFLVFFYLKIKFLNKYTDMSQITKYYTLIDGLQIEIRFAKYFWLLFEVKKILNSCFIFLVPYPIISLCLVLSLNIVFFTYIVYYKPLLAVNEQRYYVALEFMQLLICLNMILVASFNNVYLAWSTVISIGLLYLIILIYSTYVIIQIVNIKFCKKRFIVSKKTFYEEDITNRQINQIIQQNLLRVQVRQGISLSIKDNSKNYSSNSMESSRIEYLDNIHQLSIKWNKNPIYTKHVALNPLKTSQNYI